jgi:hypothetical protein
VINRCPTPFEEAERSGHFPIFVLIAFSAFAQPTLTSFSCCLRHPINLPPPGEIPGHNLATSALQYAKGSAALADSADAMTASESNEAAVNRRIIMTGLFFWSGGLTQCRY